MSYPNTKALVATALLAAAAALLVISGTTGVDRSEYTYSSVASTEVISRTPAGGVNKGHAPIAQKVLAASPHDGRFQIAALDQVDEERHSDVAVSNIYSPAKVEIEEFQDTLEVSGSAPPMIVIPGGDFMLGSPSSEIGHVKNEAPQTKVQIASFAMSKYEVTAAEFEHYLTASGTVRSGTCDVYEEGAWVRKESVSGSLDPRDPRMPTICVTWAEANDYAEWMSEQTGKKYRLPTEAEWEYAAKAGSATAFSFGDDPDSGCGHMNGADRAAEQTYKQLIGVGCNDGFSELAPVGSLLPNAFGLYDMHGNVWEWTSDAWTDSHAPGEIPDENRVIKGGSWFSYPMWLRSSNRNAWQPNLGRADVGFRIVRSVPNKN